MRTVRFGETSLMVSELCLGTSTFARYADQAESFAMLDAFRAAAGNLVQTSGQCPRAGLGDGLLGLPEEFLRRHWPPNGFGPRSPAWPGFMHARRRRLHWHGCWPGRP